MYFADCEHRNSFCESCLHHYVIYKVRNFEEVLCPHDGCPVALDTTTNFFRALPSDIQRNYKKILQFQMVSKNPDAKLCPQEKCEGVIKKTSDEVMLCNECGREFCASCLLAAHSGKCDDQ